MALNRNPAIQTSHLLMIPGHEEVNYFVQLTELPGASMAGVEAPFQNFATNMPSNRIEYDPLAMTLIVDEDFRNFESILRWKEAITQTEPVSTQMKDLTLHLLSSNKQVIAKIKFIKAYPTVLSPVPLDASVGDVTPLTCSLTFRYQKYEFIR